MKKRCIVLLLDGISTTFFESLLKKDIIPNIKKMMEKGTYIDTSTSTFPSVTGPAHVPLFTGKSSFQFHLSGHNQFHRNLRYIDYFLLYYSKLNAHLRGCKTAYDYYKNSVSIAEIIYKGASKFIRYYSGLMGWIFHSDFNTRRVLKRTKREYLSGRDLIVTWFTDCDTLPHMCKTNKKLYKTMQKIDKGIGEILRMMDSNTRLIICSDHGMEKVSERFHLKTAFKKMGLLVSKMSFNFDGSGFAQIYFKKPNKNVFWRRKMSYKQFRNYILNERNFQDLIKNFTASPGIEFLMLKKDKTTLIYSDSGIAQIEGKKNKFKYSILEGKDPFDYANRKNSNKLINKWITRDESLKFTHDAEYPDAIYQSHSLIQIQNSGEIIVTTSKNYTCNWLTPYGIHGGLRRDQMVSPLIISDKIPHPPKYIRSEKVFDYIIQRD